MAIRYDTNLTKNIQRVVRNFNQKIDRLKRIDDKLGIYDLPDKVSIKDLKKSVRSRKDLYRKLDDLSLFSQRGIENSLQTASGSISKYKLELLKKEQKRLKSYYTRKIHSYQKLSPRIAGKKQIGTFESLGDEYLQQLQARREYLEKDITKLDSEHLEYFEKFLLNAELSETRAIQFYSNYVEKMVENLGYGIGYDEEKIKYIQSKLQELTPQQFDRALRVESALKAIQEHYSDIFDETSLSQNRKDIIAKYDLLYESIDTIVAQAKNGYIE